MAGDPGKHPADEETRIREKLGMESGQPLSPDQTRVDDPAAPDADPHGPGFASGQGGLASPEEREKTEPSDQRKWDRQTGVSEAQDDTPEDQDKYRSHGPTADRR